MPLEGLIDKEAERRKLHKTLADLERQMGGLRAKLANESFTARAPAEVVAQTRAKLAELEVAEPGSRRAVESCVSSCLALTSQANSSMIENRLLRCQPDGCDCLSCVSLTLPPLPD